MAEVSLDSASRLIIEAARLKHYQPTPAVEKAFQDLTVSTRVEAALLMSPGFRNVSFNVRAKNGEVQVAGTIPQMTLEQEIIRLIEKVPGVIKVVTEELKSIPPTAPAV